MTKSTQHQPSVVTVIDDPAGRTAPLLSSWRIVNRVEVRRWIGNKAVACSLAVMREGDFVDVGISFDIFVLPLHRRSFESDAKRMIRAHLKIEHVLQLCPTHTAAEVSDVVQNCTMTVNAFRLPVSPKTTKLDSNKYCAFC